MKKFVTCLCIIMLLAFTACGEDHTGQVKTPAGSSSQAGKDYNDVIAVFEEAGFTNIKTEKIDDLVFGWLTKDGEVEEVSVNGDTEYQHDEWVNADSEVIIYYHTFPEEETSEVTQEDTQTSTTEQKEDTQTSVVEEKSEETQTSITESAEETTTTAPASETTSTSTSAYEIYYTTNSKDTYKNGNSGVYSYVLSGKNYDQYIIVDFDEGYVYRFNEGNGDGIYDKVAIVSGDLNDVMIITYHDGGSEWSYGIHFKWKNQPDQLILQEKSGVEYEYYVTDLEDALALRDSKTAVEY